VNRKPNITSEGTRGGLKRGEPEQGIREPFDCSRVLFPNVLEILNLADGDRGAVCCILALDGGFIGRTPIDGALLRHTMTADRFGQKPLGRALVPVLRQQAIDRLALCVHRAIEGVPLAVDLDGGHPSASGPTPAACAGGAPLPAEDGIARPSAGGWRGRPPRHAPPSALPRGDNFRGPPHTTAPRPG